MRDALLRILQLLYFMLPAYCANMLPPFARYWRGWNRPIAERWLGSHKTVVGFLFGVAAAILASGAQASISAPFSLVDYRYWPWLGLGFGFGAMLGDSLKSFFKRRRHIAPGARWLPFDQLDFAIGALVFVGASARLGVADVIAILLLTLVGHVAVNRAAFHCGIKDTPW